MGLAGLLRKTAASSPARVFALTGVGARDAVQDLKLDPRVRLVSTPRAATVLLVAGDIRDEFVDAILATHDQVAEPRCTVVWARGAAADRITTAIPQATVAESDLAAAVVRVHRELLMGGRNSEPALLPDVDPAPWRGVGPYGQGGSGMTGGVPFGRPLADRAPDRDGLVLDQIPLRIGPFFSTLPHGLVMDLELQGDIVQTFRLETSEVLDTGEPSGLWADAFSEPVRIAELELARARSHLRWMADALGTYGLHGLGARVLRLTAGIRAGDTDVVAALERRLRRAGMFGYATAGVGQVDPGVIVGFGLGPIARAAGLAEDVRAEDPAYTELGFEPLVGSGSDVRARWRQRVGEIVQSLRLALAAADRETELTGRVESPRGRLELGSSPMQRLADVLPRLIEGREWGDAVAILVSLDIDADSR